MKKTIIIILVIVLSVFGCFFISSYFESNNVKGDKASIEAKILNYAKNSDKTTTTATANKIIDIDDMKYVLYTTDTGCGYATMTKKITGNYGLKDMCIDNTLSKNTSAHLNANIFNYKNNSYLILSGKNVDKNIKYIEVNVNNKKYKIDIPSDDEYFAISKPIDKQPKSIGIMREDISAFDKDNNNISKDVL